MTPEKMFHELLGLGLNWEVVESRFERETGTVFLEIRETGRLWESVRCPEEGGMAFCYDHTEVVTWRHLNISNIVVRSRAGCRAASVGSAAMFFGSVRPGKV
jgi:hypothetical protein